MQGFREQFLSQARDSLLKLAESLLEQEACEKAGPRYQRQGISRQIRMTRAGSDPGTVRIGHQRVLIRKQRLKQGKQEVPLESYQALRRGDLLTARVLDCMIRGLSTRNYDELLDEISGGLGLKKSSVSRAFVAASREALEQLQTRDLSREIWGAIHIDAIHFAGRSLIVALGINGQGRKMVLGLNEGSTEGAQVCIDLLQSLIDRGLRTDLPFFFVLDGGKGLRKAVRDVFGECFPVQRCLIHKARNLEEYLPKRVHPEARRRWARLRRCERYSDAKKELIEIRHWLGTISTEAVASLDEAGEELLTVFAYGAGHVLRRSLVTTNLIESHFSQVRIKTARVRNWTNPHSKSKDQIRRWCAVALLSAERRANYVKGNAELPTLLIRLHEGGLINRTASR
ncbi:MAG: IS256 family transposase [Bdellovibrionota bacterium]